MNIEFFGNTDIGQVRKVNEDSFTLLPEANALVVCDGMGGHAAGDVASAAAKDVFIRYFSSAPDRWADRLHFSGEESLTPRAGHLVRAARLANRTIFVSSARNVAERGMGTTLVVLAFDEGLVAICHVGDSRAYRLRAGKLSRVTVDHSLAAELIAQNELSEEESRYFAERNVITRALGTRPVVDVDIREDTIARGDIYLACSDGLCGFVDDQLIERILQDAGKNLKLAGDNLIKAANAAGGEDNITVALARVDDPGAVPTRQPQAVRTISGDDAAAAGKVMDAILQELMNLTPPEEDTQKIPVAQSVAKKDGTKAGGTGSGLGRHRWLFWLFILAAGTVAVFFGGGDLFRPAEDQELSPGIPLGQSTEVEPARLIIDWGAKEVPGAVVYIDDLMRGVTADYQQPGMAVEPGLRHIRCVLESDTVLDSIINIRLGENRIFLFSSVP